MAGLTTVTGDLKGNTKRLVDTIERFAGCGVDAVVTCEAYLQGFESVTFDPATDRAVAITADAPEHEPITEAVRRTRIAAGYGYVERDGDRFYSTYRLVSPDGVVLEQRRISAGWREERADPAVYGVGEDVQVVEWMGHRTAVALCGGLWSDQPRFTGLGTDLLLWPVFVSFPPRQWLAEELDAYAEQAATVAPQALLVNGAATADDGEYIAGAALLADGQVAAVSGFDGRDTCLVVEV